MTVRLATPGGVRPTNAKSVETYSGIANGDVCTTTSGGGLINSVADRPLGIMVDSVPTDVPPTRYRVAVTGDVVYDTGLTSVSEGAAIYSDGDGTYSTTRPSSGATDSLYWILGYATSSDASGTFIELDIQATTEAT